MDTAAIKVLLVEKHGFGRGGIRLILERANGIVVVGEAAGVQEGIRRFQDLRANMGVDVVVTDLVLSDGSGLEFARLVKASGAGTRVLLLMMYLDTEQIRGMLHSGADGHFLRLDAAAELQGAVQAVARGEHILSSGVAQRLLVHLRRSVERAEPQEPLSAHDQHVLALLSEGETSKMIARHLGLTTKMVDHFRSHLIGKLDVVKPVAASPFAFPEGLMANGQ